MPADVKVGDLKWISVWCRRFSIDFGSLIFPDNLDLAKSEDSETEPEPESESEPEPYVSK